MLVPQTNTMTSQVQSLEQEIEPDKDQDWSQSLRAGPECLAILGGVYPSHDEAERDRWADALREPHLLRRCPAKKHSVSRPGGMKKVAAWTDEISKALGVWYVSIFASTDLIAMSVPSAVTAARDEYLLGMVERGEELVADCRNELEKIDTSFEEWYKVTKALHYALQAKLGECRTRRQEQETEDQIKQYEIERTFSEKQQMIVEEGARERQKKYDKILERRERYDEMVTDLGLGIGSIIGKMFKCVAGGAVLLAVGYVHYRSLSAELYSAEEAQAKRDRELHELEVSQAKLETAVAHLSTESKSIEEVARIVEESIQKVMELQGLIRTFMEFLLDLNAIISNTVSRSKLVYDTMSNRDGLKDPLIKKDLWENALAMKIRFIFVAKASHIYNAVSKEFIEPTANRFQGLRRLNKANDEELRQAIHELYALRRGVCDGTERLASRMHQELKDALSDVPTLAAGGSEDIKTRNGEWDYVSRPQQVDQ
ncbi:predicted protein [Aspergillus terreus NIH2624]|uniref:Uncharacterized protein n=1 Tax=Aspergillus terreus (strain NIH 2624 / FGSC A1156) TaxID=341663 RepID=Q0CGS4_ASPTN|nr:uncharacterized protein ATEG_07118 [Aspergillus terreus NIH2624]EAU32502.1 predicted protein [Aspergillus terreus NIH2624]